MNYQWSGTNSPGMTGTLWAGCLTPASDLWGKRCFSEVSLFPVERQCAFQGQGELFTVWLCQETEFRTELVWEKLEATKTASGYNLNQTHEQGQAFPGCSHHFLVYSLIDTVIKFQSINLRATPESYYMSRGASECAHRLERSCEHTQETPASIFCQETHGCFKTQLVKHFCAEGKVSINNTNPAS